jgi:ketosteroid isomerase-like protein
MPHDPIDIVRIFHQAYADRDVERVVACLHPDVEWTSAENFIYVDHSPYRGIDAVVKLIFGRVLGDWDQFSLSSEEVLGGGDLAISNGRMRGVFKANGASVDAQFVQVFQVKDGKIYKCQVYTDTAQFKEAVNQIRLAGV